MGEFADPRPDIGHSARLARSALHGAEHGHQQLASGDERSAARRAQPQPGPAKADPDFPSIPQQGDFPGVSEQEPEPGQSSDSDQQQAPAERTGAGSQDNDTSPPSGQDCVALKFAVERVNALLSAQVPVSQGFASKDLGEQAVDKDLDVLNQVEQYLVYAESGVEDTDQRAKIEAYKAALGQVSATLSDRRAQDLAKPAPYEWVGKLSDANARASGGFLAIGNTCPVR